MRALRYGTANVYVSLPCKACLAAGSPVWLPDLKSIPRHCTAPLRAIRYKAA